MKKRTFRFQSTRLAIAALMALLAGCALNPTKPEKIVDEQLKHLPPTPQPVFGPQDHVLACLGDILAMQKIQPLVIGYPALTDTTGKVGVDFVAVGRSELGKVTTRGNNLAMTAMGFGPSAKPELPSVEERLIHQQWLMQEREGVRLRQGACLVIKEAAEVVAARRHEMRDGAYQPGTSEFLDLVAALAELWPDNRREQKKQLANLQDFVLNKSGEAGA